MGGVDLATGALCTHCASTVLTTVSVDPAAGRVIGTSRPPASVLTTEAAPGPQG